jgi:hypothetical protein
MYRVMLSGNGEIALRLSAALILGSALGLNRSSLSSAAMSCFFRNKLLIERDVRRVTKRTRTRGGEGIASLIRTDDLAFDWRIIRMGLRFLVLRHDDFLKHAFYAEPVLNDR